jgi:hypothetical protein
MPVTCNKPHITIYDTKLIWRSYWCSYILPAEVSSGFELQNRLDRMLYVGLTEDHEESARLFAHMVGAQVLSQPATFNLDIKEDLPGGNGNTLSLCSLMGILYNCASGIVVFMLFRVMGNHPIAYDLIVEILSLERESLI